MVSLRLNRKARDGSRDGMLSLLPNHFQMKEDISRCGLWGFWSQNKFNCQEVGCPRCRWLYIKREQRKALTRYASARREDMSLLTVMLGIARNPEEIGPGWTKARKDMRNFIDAQRRGSRRWLHWGMTAYLEAYPFHEDEASLLGENQQELIGSMGLPSRDPDGSPFWFYHIHALVHHPKLEWQQVRETFARRYAHPYQIDVQPFYDWRDRDKSIRAIVCYSNKYQPADLLGNTVRYWPSSWTANYFYWCHRFSDWHKSLRLVVNGAPVDQATGSELARAI